MGIGDQWSKIKDNWLIIVIVLILLVVLASFSSCSLLNSGARSISSGYTDSYAGAGLQNTLSKSTSGSYYPSYNSNFAPEQTDRKITKSANMNSEVPKGTFASAESKLKNVISSSGSFLLNQNVYTSDAGNDAYKSGTYYIKVDASKYDAVIAQLKDVGDIKSFQESATDITGQYVNTKLDLEAEKTRLERYKQMYDQATIISDKIALSDKMFDQERTISYLEDSMNNVNQQVSYSSISVSLNEKRSTYADVAFVKFSNLVKTCVGSINALFYIIVVLLPFAVVALLIWLIVHLVRRH
jgi:hypothetical protein